MGVKEDGITMEITGNSIHETWSADGRYRLDRLEIRPPYAKLVDELEDEYMAYVRFRLEDGVHRGRVMVQILTAIKAYFGHRNHCHPVDIKFELDPSLPANEVGVIVHKP